MSWFDLGAVVLVMLAILDGARNGLAWAGLESALLVLTALTARGLHVHVEPYVLKVAELAPDDVRCAAHVAVFVTLACLAAGALILLHPASKRWRFRHDAWFGGALGAVNGALAALLVFSLIVWASPRPGVEDALAESRLVPVLRSVQGSGFAGMFPEYLTERLTQLDRP